MNFTEYFSWYTGMKQLAVKKTAIIENPVLSDIDIIYI